VIFLFKGSINEYKKANVQCFLPAALGGKDSLIMPFIIYLKVFDGINNAVR